MSHTTLAVDKFYRFIPPNTLKVFAVCISQFVDALIVAALLGSEAMAIVNLGSPIILAVATLTALLTVGGSTLYASACGSFNKNKADRIFTVSAVAALLSSALLMLGLLFSKQVLISTLCAGNQNLAVASGNYMGILITSIPVLTMGNVLFGFLPSAGKPKLSSALMLLANLVNLCLDIVFIKFVGLGVEGAAYASLCGYSVALLWYVVCYLRRKLNMSFVHITAKDFRELKSICSMGTSASVSQLSLAIKIAVCNSIALYFGGNNALIAFSVCMQLLSITSIFVGGIGSSMINITATLCGQKDFPATEKVIRNAYFLIFVCSSVVLVIFELLAPQIAILYKAYETEVLRMTIHAIRIFSLTILLRNFIVVFMFYVQSIRKTMYATFISLFDGFLGQLPLAYIACLQIGIDGLWWSFPLNSLLLTVIVLIWNNRLLKHSNPSSFRNLLLVEREADVIIEKSGTELLSNVKESLLVKDEIIASRGWTALLLSYLASLLKENNPVKFDYHIREYSDKIVLDIHSNVSRITNPVLAVPERTQVSNEMILDMNSLRAVSD